MIRTNFRKALEDLQKDILKMANIVEDMISDSIKALVNQDEVLAQSIIDRDSVVDDLDIAIEDKALKLIATQQPMGKDLRTIGTAFNITNDLERMADLSCDIAKTVLRIGKEPFIKSLIDIPRMAELARKMVGKSIDSYVKEDVSLAAEISADDDQVDNLYKQILRELIVIMIENPKTITQATQLLFISRHLERIADHATNICEDVVFLVVGERKDLNP